MCSVRKERESQAYLEVRPGSPCEHSLVLLVRTRARARITRRRALSLSHPPPLHPLPPPPPSPSPSPTSPPFCYPFLFLARGRRLDVLFRSSRFSRLFAPRSRSVFLRCSKRAGPAITRSRLTVAPCMAACFMLPASHCDAHRASEQASECALTRAALARCTSVEIRDIQRASGSSPL